LKLFQCFISHVTTPETEIKLFQLLKLLPATPNVLENTRELQ